MRAKTQMGTLVTADVRLPNMPMQIKFENDFGVYIYTQTRMLPAKKLKGKSKEPREQETKKIEQQPDTKKTFDVTSF